MDEHELDQQLQAMESDTHVQAAEAAAAAGPPKRKRITVAELNKAIDDIRDVKFPETLDWLGELAVRLEKIESGSLSDRTDAAADIDARLDNQDAAIGALAGAIRDISEGVATWGGRMKPELEFAPPPQQTASVSASKGDIEAVASVCQTMTDVLLICRMLKAEQSIPDEDRTYLLTIACRAAGVPLSGGLQIRAGASSVDV